MLHYLAVFAFDKLPIKKYLLNKISNYAQNYTHSKISINDLGIFTPGFYFSDITIYDLNDDTLFHIGKIDLTLPRINTTKKEFTVYQLAIDTLYMYQHYDSLGNDNLAQWLKWYSTDTTNNQTNTEPWTYESERIQIGNIHIISKNDSSNLINGKFNSQDIEIKANADILNFYNQGEVINFRLNKFNLKEKSGLKIKNLSTDLNYNPNEISLDNFELLLNKSRLYFKQINASPNKCNNFAEVYKNGLIRLYAHKDSALQIFTSDLSYFTDSIPNTHFTVHGNIKGNINGIQLHAFNLKLGSQNQIFINANIQNMQNMAKLSFEIPQLEIKSNLNVLNNKLGNILNLPFLNDTLANIDLKAKAFGSLKDANIEAKLNTLFGQISLDTKLDYNDTSYLANGEFWSNKLKSKQLPGSPYDSLQIELYNKFSIQYSKNEIKANMAGKLSEITLEETKLDSMSYNFQIDNNHIVFKLLSEDANLNFTFFSNLYFYKNNIIGNNKFTLNRANLNALKLDQTFTTKIIKIDLLTTEFNFNNIDSFTGNIEIKNINYTTPFQNLLIKKIVLKADSIGTERRIILYSDFLNAKAQGKFTSSELIKAAKTSLKQFIPTVFEEEQYTEEELTLNHPLAFDNLDENKKLSFDIQIKNILPLTEIFAPDYYVAPKSKIKGLYFLDLNYLEFNAKTDSISFVGNSIKNLDFDVRTMFNKLILSASSDGISIVNQVYLNQFTMDWQVSKDTSYFTCDWGNFAPIHNYSGEINVRLVPQKIDSIDVNYQFTLSPTEIILDDKTWSLEQAEINISTDKIAINNLNFYNEIDKVSLNGNISENLSDTLKIRFQNFQLENLNQILQGNGLIVSGKLNGDLNLINLLDIPIIFAKDTIFSFTINNQNIGNTYIHSDYDKKNDYINIKLLAETGRRLKTQTLLITGNYSPSTNYINLDTITLYHLRTKTIEPFLTGYLSNPVGYINGNLSMKGNIAEPEITGEIILAKTKFTIDYLQSRFNISDTIFIEPGKIILSDFQMEQAKNTATINGTLEYANGFEELNIDIGLFTNNFNLLNTRQTDTSYFYGSANLATDIKIYGTPDDIQIKISGTTMPGTRFFIPLTSESDIEETAFLTFESTENQDINTEPVLYSKEVSKMEMDFTLTVTPDAEIQLIFDEKVGDIIKARGQGNIKMLINANGDLSMYGDYIVTKGDYLFTLGSTLNKKFTVEKGGLIRWNGDPYNAEISLNAIYSVKKVALYELTYDDNDKNTKIPADCKLNMTNNLEQPVIKFGIDLPTAGEDLVQQFTNLPADELNKQILSLLIFNKFQALPGYKQEAPKQGGVDFNTSEMLTNQLSHWLSQISNDLDIGINYNTGDSLGGSELEVELSTQLLNERLSINSNFGVSNSTQNTNNQNFVGDMELEYKIDKSGKFKAKAFTKTNQNDIYFEQVPYSYGLGIFYRHEFDKLLPLFKTKKNKTDSTKLLNN